MANKTAHAIVLAALSSPAVAGGFALEHQNAEALGAAFAGAEAKSGDAGFAAHNPASIATIERAEFGLSATGIFPDTRYEGAAGALFGAAPIAGDSEGRDAISNAIVPNLSLAVPLTDRLTAGLVVNATFGFKTTYDQASVVRYQARVSDLKVMEATPMLAYEISSALRVGGGLRIQRADLALTSTIDAGGIAAASLVPGFAPGSSDLDATFEAESVALGFSVGAQADLSPTVAVGASYSSKIDHDIDGDADFDLATSPAAQTLNAAAGLFSADGFSASLTTPAIAAAGVRVDASERLTLLASMKVMFWSSFDAVSLDFNDVATPTEVLTQNWRDSWSVSLGAEYRLDDGNAVRGGLMYDESPVNGAFASPRIPDGDRHWATLGVTHALNDSLTVDLGAAYAFFSDRRINLDGAAPENFFRGALTADFTTDVFAGSLRLRCKF
jgi:long-chain fatty acid transport protein